MRRVQGGVASKLLGVILNTLVVLALLFHTITWLNLAPKAARAQPSQYLVRATRLAALIAMLN